MQNQEDNEIVVLTEDGNASSSVAHESVQKEPVRQKRLLSWMLSKKVPPVPDKTETKEYPQTTSNFVQYLFFWWLHPLFNVGYKRTIEDTDLWTLREDQKVEHNYSLFNNALNKNIDTWRQANPSKSPNAWPVTALLSSIMMPFKIRWIMALALSLFYEYSLICIAVVTKYLIQFVERRLTYKSSTPLGPGVGYALLIMVLNLSAALFSNHMNDLSMKYGLDIQAILTKKTLHKSMLLNNKGKSQFPVTYITSLIGNDLSRFEYASAYFAVSFGILSGLVGTISLLLVNIGVSALAGIAILLISCAFQGASSKKLYKLRTELNVFTDMRVSYITEILKYFKVIKLYNWEEPYYEKLSDTRISEMKLFMKMKLTRNMSETASLGVPLLSTMTSFLILYKLRGVSDVASIFSSLSLFELLGQEITFLPMIFSTTSDAISAMKRVQKLLQAEELSCEEVASRSITDADSNLSIELKSCHFEWEKFDGEELDTDNKSLVEEAHELQSQVSRITNSIVPIESVLLRQFKGFNDLNLSINKGEFLVVTGMIGSGKTSLLNAIDGNMKQTEGHFQVNGTKIFCSTPWIQNTTIRENIVFGSLFDAEKYKKVVFACALIEDFKQLENGDNTEVGERGITLSGGQKARINLARAVYSDRDILLLDDVLSAVDAKVGQHIMKHCFMDLLKDKTRLLATHQLSLVGSCDRVIFLNRDSEVDMGSLEEVKSRNLDFAKLLTFSNEFQKQEEDEVSKPLKEEEEEDDDDYESVDGQQILEERKAINRLKLDVYTAFLFPGDGLLKLVPFLTLAATVAFATFCTQFISVWLSFWTEYKFDGMGNHVYVGLYVMFNVLAVFFTLTRLVSLSWVVNKASLVLVSEALKKLLHAPMSFMDVTPFGRIFNRFTKDADVLDNELLQVFNAVLNQLSAIVGSIILSVVYLPWIAISLPFLSFLWICISDYSQSSIREIKRIEAVRKSFIFNNTTEILAGLSTIKAYNAENRFISKNDHYLNRSVAGAYTNYSGQRWLAVNLTFISATFAFLVSILAATGVFHVSPAATGVLLTSILSFSEYLTSLFRSLSTFENAMNSAERMHQYSKYLEQEAPFKVSEFTPNPQWPQNPSIEFENVLLSYRKELPLVLKNVSFQVSPGEKIGICGRTGAGKSTIISALYRISELSQGKIVIDGLDISRMGLLDLRSRLSIIPQETVLFKGTMRFNLDPFGEHSDAELLAALNKIGLLKNGDASKFHLDLIVEDDGLNFSLGEKQLIALVRAMTRDSKILILDEATSSVDYETDARIQSTIKKEFGNYTILCIAHRLKTILDYDKILVLDAGEVKEFDTPLNLFLEEDGIFRDMCEKSNISKLDFDC